MIRFRPFTLVLGLENAHAAGTPVRVGDVEVEPDRELGELFGPRVGALDPRAREQQQVGVGQRSGGDFH